MHSVNQKIKIIREVLKVSQSDFATSLGLKRNTISLIENGKRNPSERTLNDICEKFNVNEEWLKNDMGEMFYENDKSIIAELSAQYSLDDLDKKILETYLNLSIDQRKVIKDYAKNLINALDENSSTVEPKTSHNDEIEYQVNAYRQELVAEQKGEISSASQEKKENLKEIIY